MEDFILESVFNEARYPEVTFVRPKEFPHIRSAFRAEGKHITISGPSGSGKSTLVNHLLRDFGIDSALMFNGRAYSSFDSCFQILGMELKCEPKFDAVTPLLQKLPFAIVDDFHHLSLTARAEIVSNLKLWHEKGVRFVIVGIASSAPQLLGSDTELGIRNDPFELKTQDEAFVLELIGLGEKALNIRFSDELKHEIVAASNGVPSVVHVICRNACIEAGVEKTVVGDPRVLDFKLRTLKDPVLRIFTGKYFDKVVGLAKGKQQARSVHNTYFDIIEAIGAVDRSEIPTEWLYERIVGGISDPKLRARKATSFYNCLNNLDDVIKEKGLDDILLYSKDGKYISIEDPSFRFYLNLLDMSTVRKRVHVRHCDYSYDVAVSFAGDIRPQVMQFVQECKQRGLDVFYDFDQQAQLWGQDLRKKLSEIYANEALFMVVFLSASYPEKDWPSFELAVGKGAAAKRTSEYLLPIRVDDANVVGLKDTVAHLDIRTMPVDKMADLLAAKIEQAS